MKNWLLKETMMDFVMNSEGHLEGQASVGEALNGSPFFWSSPFKSILTHRAQTTNQSREEENSCSQTAITFFKVQEEICKKKTTKKNISIKKEQLEN